MSLQRPLNTLMIDCVWFSNQEKGTAHGPNMKVPLAGDLLGRERVTGAKRVRMGCDQPEERYENIIETPALNLAC